MNLLLVDDEEYVIRGIKQNIDWKACGIRMIYTAFSMKQAQRILEMASVDVIISDIIMPEESGLDLIDWVREKGYAVQVIFLTSYAEFDYAQKAISLNSVDYLLKPIDFDRLSQALKEAVKKAEKIREYEGYRQESRHWKQNQAVVRRDFWREVLAGGVTPDCFLQEARRHRLFYQEESFWLLYTIFDQKKEKQDVWDEWTLNFAVGNVLDELLDGSSYRVETVVSVEKSGFAVICRKTGGGFEDRDIRKDFERFISWFKEISQMDWWCGVSPVKDGAQMAAVLCRIQDMRDNSLSVRNKVLYLSDFVHPDNRYLNPNVNLWTKLLDEGKEKELVTDIKRYLETTEQKEMITRPFLEAFRMDVTQIVYSWLAQKEIKAHLLFSGKKHEADEKNALRGMEEAQEYASSLIGQAVRYVRYVNKTASVTEKIRQYIDVHYREEIRRDTLAEMVYLNTDYMSRIFKKEIGVSISSYILNKRVEEAKMLLGQSDLPINTVSIYVGYSNFSYFTKMFRENTGYSPLEYRRKQKKEGGSV